DAVAHGLRGDGARPTPARQHQEESTMFPLALTTAALALGGLGCAAVAHAGVDSTIGKQVLDALCIEDKGAPVFTPYAIGRCQAARAQDGFAIERLVC